VESVIETLTVLALRMPYWEECAVAFGIIYLLLAMRQNIACWYAAFASTLIYMFLFWDVRLLMESGLQVYYLVMAIFGWWQWRHHNKSGQKEDLEISSWSVQQHSLAIGGTLILAAISGQLLSENTDAAHPYLDSFTTWGAVITTYMVTRKVLENWLYWIVIDGLSIFLYLDRELYPTAALFVAYEVIVVIGYFQWRKEYNNNQETNNLASLSSMESP